jgi:protein-tyrosine phosphatase
MLPPIWLQLAGPAARPAGHPDATRIVSGLYVGEYPTPDDCEWLRGLGVAAVLCLQDDADLGRKGLDLGELKRAYEKAKLRFHRVPVADGDATMLVAHLDATVTWLAQRIEAGEEVYLHCNAGLNRAPTVAVAYLHVCHGMGLFEARDLVKSRRPCVPYMRALEEYYGR